MTEAALSLEGVTKRYRHSDAGVHDLTFDVGAGQVFGFLGPNGAGKTTTIRMVLDLLRPDHGSIRLFGLDAHRDAVAAHRRLGYVPGDLALWDRFCGQEVLDHLAHLRGDVEPARRAELVERLDLDLERPLRTLSKGNRQKLGLVQALMSDPDLLVLDEPTTGLDPLVQKQVHTELRRRAGEGTAVFLSSHVLGEVAAVADRVGIIRDGRLVAVEATDALRRRAVHRVTATLAEPTPAGDRFGRVPGVRSCRVEGAVVHLEVSGPIDPLIKALATVSVEDLEVVEPSLEDVFLAMYERTPAAAT